MFFFDIKCLILISIENILVLEGLRKVREHGFTPYRSFYLRNDRRNNDFDYSFKDWETTTPDTLYFFNNKLLNITENHIYNQTLDKEENNTMVTNVTYSVQTIPTEDNLTIVTQETGEKTSKQEVISNTESTFINQTLESMITTIQETNTAISLTNNSTQVQNSSSPDIKEIEGLNVTLPSEATIEDILNWLATTSTTEYTTVIPPPPTINVEDLMTGIADDILDHTNPLLPPTTSDPILGEIKDEIKMKHGHFSSSIHELLIVLSHKSSSDFVKLLTAMNTKIDRYIATDSLVVFGNIIVEVFQSVLQMLILAPHDVRKEYINFAIYSVFNRHTAMNDDVNSVFEVIDGIYTDNDVDKIASVLNRIEGYPNTTTDANALVTDTLNAFIFEPHNRILGSAKERLLMTEINYMLEHRLYPGKDLGRRYMNRKNKGKLLPRQNKSTNKIADHQYSRKHTNIKPTNIKGVQNIFFRKNAEKKYNTNKITTAINHFYGKKDIKNTALENALQSFPEASFESSCSHNDSSGYYLESRNHFKSKTVKDKNNLKSDKKYFKAYNKYLNRNKPTYTLEVHKKGAKYHSVLTHASKRYSTAFDKLISAQSAEENILKLNLIDALIHSGKTIKGKKVMKRINKVRHIESISDDEAILKSNIYKVFGLSNDFRKQLRTQNVLRRTSSS